VCGNHSQINSDCCVALTDVGETRAKDNERKDDDVLGEGKAPVCLHPDISDNV